MGERVREGGGERGRRRRVVRERKEEGSPSRGQGRGRRE